MIETWYSTMILRGEYIYEGTTEEEGVEGDHQ